MSRLTMPPAERPTPLQPAAVEIEAAASLIAAARRPMIFTGSGAQHASAEIRALAREIDAPVVAFRGGRGVMGEDDPLGISSYAGFELWPETDVAIAIGTRAELPYMRWTDMMTLIDRPNIGVDVVVGAGNPNRDTIQALCNQLPNVAFHSQVSNMADLIHNADLGVGAGGATIWERCFLGLPTITVVSAANQERTTEDVAELGAIEYLGWSTQLRPEDYARAITGMLEDPQRVKRIGEAALHVVQAEGEGLQDAMYRIIQKADISHSIPRVITQ